MTKNPVPSGNRSRAKTLRTNQTDAEQALWKELRAHRFSGLGFRRQVPIGPYIVDFVCQAERMIIEVDGGGHGFDEKRKADAARTDWLKARGYRMLRFWNNEILNNLEGVLMRISEVCGGAVSPPPGTEVPTSPSRGEVS